MLRVEKCNSLVIAWHFSSFGRTKKFCALARSFWPLGRFWDFFCLRQAKKIPKTGRKPKWPCRSKFFFVLPHDDIVVHFSMTHYIDFCLNVGLGGSFKYPCCIIKMTILVVTIDPGGPGDNFLNWPTLVIYRLFYCLDFVNFIKKTFVFLN